MKTPALFRTAVALVCLLASQDALGANCSRTSIPGLVPINDLGAGTYRGFVGGLYPNGSNLPPDYHRQAGIEQALLIRPLNRKGVPASTGVYVLLSIGMSNTTSEFETFKTLAEADLAKNPKLVIVNGATSGCGAISLADRNDPAFQSCWGQHLAALTTAGVSPQQVVAVWIKEAESNPINFRFPQDAQRLQQALEGSGPWHPGIIPHARSLFPSLRLVYLSSRIYAGYATTTASPEPWAYQTGFGVKWTVEGSLGLINPWIGWGPYLWANGLRRRSDGLTWACSDFERDGTHPSPAGQQKVGGLLLQFFKTDPTTTPWFLAPQPRNP